MLLLTRGLLSLLLLLPLLQACQPSSIPSTAADTTAAARAVPATDTPAAPAARAIATTPASRDWLIVPAMGIGHIHLDQDAQEVYAALGRPDGGDAAMQHAVAIWYSNHDRAGYSTTIYTSRDAGNAPAARVRQIRVSSPSFRTAEGLGSGVGLAAIRQVFSIRPVETYQSGGQSYTVYDSPRGIAFEIAADSTCSAVIVHKAGETGGTAYLKLRP